MTRFKLVGILMIIFIFLTTYQAIADEEVLPNGENKDVIEEIINQDQKENEPEILVEEESKKLKEISVIVTAYTLKECYHNKGITASGKRVQPGIVAVSPDLEKIGLKLGSRVKINGVGTFHVMDRTSTRLKKTIDIYMVKYSDAIKFGKRKLLATIYEK